MAEPTSRARRRGAESPAHVRWRGAAAAAVALAGLSFYAAAFRATYTDDAFIQLKYADTLARTGAWGMYPGHTTNTATSPLNVMLLAGFGTVLPSMLDAVAWATAAELVVLLIVLCGLGRRLFGGNYFGVLAFLGFAANPLLLSTLGLEPVLYVTLFALSLYWFVAARWGLLAVSLALLTLARADGMLLFLVLLVALPLPWRRRAGFALSYVAVLTPWHLYSWIHLGSLVPDTLILKAHQGAWGAASFASGLCVYYVEHYPAATLSSFPLLPFAVLAWHAASRETARLMWIVGTYGALHYLAYALIRVPPYHWYYTHLMLVSVLLGSLGLASRAQLWAGAVRFGPRAVAAATLLVPAAGLILLVCRSGFPLAEAPIHTNWATQAQYAQAGLWLRQHIEPDATIALRGEIGTLAFYSDRYLLNNFSDRREIDALLAKTPYARHTLVRALMRVNFWWRRAPAPWAAPRYRLEHTGAERPAAAGAVMTWETSSAWRPHGRLSLWRLR